MPKKREKGKKPKSGKFLEMFSDKTMGFKTVDLAVLLLLHPCEYLKVPMLINYDQPIMLCLWSVSFCDSSIPTHRIPHSFAASHQTVVWWNVKNRWENILRLKLN